MKKWLALLMTVALLVAMLVGCVNVTNTNSDDDDETKKTEATQPSGTSAPTTAPTGSGDPTTAPTGSGDPTTAPTTATDPTGATNPSNPAGSLPTVGGLATEVILDGSVCEFKWAETDSNKGVLTIAEVMEFSAEDMAMLGLTGPLVFRSAILTFDVTFTKSGAAAYVAEGAISSVSASVEGEAAAEFIELMLSMADEGDSELDNLSKRVMNGEVLTDKEDIENYIWQFDVSAKATFAIENEQLVMQLLELNYISWGDRITSKEVWNITDNVVRVHEFYESGELTCISYFRANGIIEKVDYYSNGKITDTDTYDEEGNLKMEISNKTEIGQ